MALGEAAGAAGVVGSSSATTSMGTSGTSGTAGTAGAVSTSQSDGGPTQEEYDEVVAELEKLKAKLQS